MFTRSVADSEGAQGVGLNPLPAPHFKISYENGSKFGFSETKLFHFHGIFKKNEIKSAKRTPIPFYIRNPGSAPADFPVQKIGKTDLSVKNMAPKGCCLLEQRKLKKIYLY